jgi:hypothetical protein
MDPNGAAQQIMSLPRQMDLLTLLLRLECSTIIQGVAFGMLGTGGTNAMSRTQWLHGR